MTFEQALELLKQGKNLRRTVWREYSHISMSELFSVEHIGKPRKCLLSYKQGEAYKSWTPNTEDLFAEDWETIE